MNICVFSKKGILYDNQDKGPVLAMFVPNTEQKRQFADITNPSSKVLKERYGVLEGEVLYRTEAGIVHAYGQLPKELYDARAEVKVFLVEDLVPLDVDVLYYAVGENLIVHSVKTTNLDGSVSWSSVYIELEEKGAGMLNIMENLISERLVLTDNEKIMIGYTGLSYDIKEELYRRLNPFGVVIEPIEKLNGYKSKTPIYAHKDTSVVMLIVILIAFILFALSVSYYFSGQQSLSRSDNKITQLRQEFKQSLSKRRLKKVANPQEVKNSIEHTFLARPSAILHAAAEVASLFGVIDSISLEKNRTDRVTRATENRPEDDVLYVIATVRSSSKNLLIDQERLAKSIYETRKWIHSIERSSKSGDGSLVLKIGVYVDNNGA